MLARHADHHKRESMPLQVAITGRQITLVVTYVVALGEFNAASLSGATGRLHHECAIAALGKEIVVPGVLVPAAALELGWCNDLW